MEVTFLRGRKHNRRSERKISVTTTLESKISDYERPRGFEYLTQDRVRRRHVQWILKSQKHPPLRFNSDVNEELSLFWRKKPKI